MRKGFKGALIKHRRAAEAEAAAEKPNKIASGEGGGGQKRKRLYVTIAPGLTYEQ